MLPSASLMAPKRPPKALNASEVASFNSAKSLLDGCMTDLDSIESVSDALIDQLTNEKAHIAHEVRDKIDFYHFLSFSLFPALQFVPIPLVFRHYILGDHASNSMAFILLFMHYRRQNWRKELRLKLKRLYLLPKRRGRCSIQGSDVHYSLLVAHLI